MYRGPVELKSPRRITTSNLVRIASIDPRGADCTQSLSFLVHSNWETGASEAAIYLAHSSLARGRASRSLQSLNYHEKRKGLRAFLGREFSLRALSRRQNKPRKPKASLREELGMHRAEQQQRKSWGKGSLVWRSVGCYVVTRTIGSEICLTRSTSESLMTWWRIMMSGSVNTTSTGQRLMVQTGCWRK